jgi:hypothetical protein
VVPTVILPLVEIEGNVKVTGVYEVSSPISKVFTSGDPEVGSTFSIAPFT